jgi:hypothetical protein
MEAHDSKSHAASLEAEMREVRRMTIDLFIYVGLTGRFHHCTENKKGAGFPPARE